MDGMNMQASFNNLTQMDRVQQDRHQLPIVNQEQNADMAKKNAAERLEKPNEVENTDGKIIDPKKKRDEEQRKREKREREKKQKNRIHKTGDSGHFVDFSV